MDVFPAQLTTGFKIMDRTCWNTTQAFLCQIPIHSTKIEYRKMRLDGKMFQNCERCLKSATRCNENSGKYQVRWAILYSKMKREYDEKNRVNTDSRIHFVRGTNDFLTKALFTFGCRRVGRNECHVVETTEAPLLLYLPKPSQKTTMRLYYRKTFRHYDQNMFDCFVLHPNQLYKIDSGITYYLITVQKTLFALHRIAESEVIRLPSLDALPIEPPVLLQHTRVKPKKSSWWNRNKHDILSRFQKKSASPKKVPSDNDDDNDVNDEDEDEDYDDEDEISSSSSSQPQQQQQQQQQEENDDNVEKMCIVVNPSDVVQVDATTEVYVHELQQQQQFQTMPTVSQLLMHHQLTPPEAHRHGIVSVDALPWSSGTTPSERIDAEMNRLNEVPPDDPLITDFMPSDDDDEDDDDDDGSSLQDEPMDLSVPRPLLNGDDIEKEMYDMSEFTKEMLGLCD